MPPDFLCIGAHKAGTTWLHQMLGRHPDIGLPENKELHFWDKGWPAGKPISSYEQAFSAIDRPIRGEITPAYAILPRSTIRVIHDHYLALRLIYILRNPLERAWSHARMGYSKHFHDDAADIIESRHDWFVEHFHWEASRLRGDYEACIRNWLTAYPEEQLFIRIQEEFAANRRAFLKECCTFIGARADYFDTLAATSLEERIYPEITMHGSQPSALPRDIPGSLLAPLLEIYTPKIASLADFMHKDLTGLWLAPYASRT